MKKVLSAIMALCMILSICSFSVSAAPEGTAISTEAEFLAMDPAGTYYLANDITVNAPYEQAFTGTFDGNGKTVTVSQPMFADFGGKIKNLTIEGSITALAADAEIAIFAAQGARGAVAATVSSGTEVVFENIKNNATVSGIGNIPDSDDCAGGIVGLINNAAANVSFIKCENNAAITGLNQIGGIAGFIKAAASVTFDGCVNNGAITETGTSAYSAGIVCRSDAEFTTFKGCVNNATISAGKDQAGGMLAYAAKGSFVVDGCVNNGTIAPTVGKAAGIVANINCNDASGAKGYYVTITNCVNNANITAGGDAQYAAGIASTVQNNLAFNISNCVNYGEINGTHDSGGIVGHTTQALMKLSFCENFGKVTTTSDQYAGGIIGYAWGTKQTQFSAETFDYTNIVEFNINHADITGDLRTGGIVGSFGASDSRGIWLCQYNINLGNVTSIGTGGKLSGDCAGGIVGYAYGSGKVACAYIMNNLSIGNVESKGSEGVASYILGYISSNNLSKITSNTVSGTVTAANGNAFAFGWNNNEAYTFLDCSGNTIPADCTLPHTRELGANDKVYEVGAFDMAKLVSGEYVYNFNQAAGKDVLYMTVNGTDFVPTVIADDDKVVVKNADGTYGNPVKEPETTEPVVPEAPEAGDTAPIFAAIEGATIKNLTVAGAIDGAAADAAAVAVNAAGAVTFENITNKATITNAVIGAGILAIADVTATVTMTACINEAAISTTSHVAGLIAYINNNINTITDCVNNGEINSTSGSAAGIIACFGAKTAKADVDKVIIINCVNNANVYTDGTQAGGMLAYLVGGTEIKGCVNKGNITSSNNKAGGIFGTSVKDTKNVCAISVENCINYGTVSAPKVAAGIVGRLGRAVQIEGMNYYIKNCINYGDVVAYTAITYDKATLYIGGIAGYCFGGSLVPANGVVNCVNLGNINADRSHLTGKSSLYIGGLVAYVNAANFECKNNVNAGIVTINGEVTGMGNVIYNKKLEGATAETNNYSVKAAEGATDSFTNIVTADQIANGEVAYLINEAAGETIYYQAIGTDKAPVLVAAEDGSNTVLKNADGTYGNPVKEPETTEPVVPEAPEAGDSAIIFAVVAIIALLGVATVAKRREN